jgi:hypothetical protein
MQKCRNMWIFTGLDDQFKQEMSRQQARAQEIPLKEVAVDNCNPLQKP